MAQNTSKLQKLAWGFSALFLFVYLLDFVPGIMAENGKMFGLFSMTPIVDFGHLALGVLAALSAWRSAKASRIYFYVLGVWYGIDVIMFFVSHFNEPAGERGGEHAAFSYLHGGVLDRDQRRTAPCESGQSLKSSRAP